MKKFTKTKTLLIALILSFSALNSSDLLATDCMVIDNMGQGSGSLPFQAIVGRECGQVACPLDPAKQVKCDNIRFAPGLSTVFVPFTVPVKENTVIDGEDNVTVTGNLLVLPVTS